MEHKTIIDRALLAGAMFASPVELKKISFYPSLRELCTMNKCGCYGTNWSCPPGCGEIEDLAKRVSSYQNGVVFQYIGQLEDSFDFDGMMACGEIFQKITIALKESMSVDCDDFLVMGAGKCTLCESCTYPDAPCRFPEQSVFSVEACGINVSELCAASELNYINGTNTITNIGLIVY